MKGYKHFLDSVFYNTDINELVERHKCRATGKVRFNSRPEATFFVHWLKWRIRKWLEKPTRQKHRNKGFGARGSTPRYVYYCEFCDGYHITKEHPYSYHKRTEKY
ncbi:hypothetical protein [Sphingobacterium yanglingense]|uniref:Uncharacterized protein n=1 Tax=Sphingobacterium yanglingense TaxID=1437280 RepID=A0A4R6WMA5_9SPHI|nr:hypothetical protein [Sphingobacterium yanglingense]TDQ79465.1 hypothetical protein CLV99_0903 [Sphingobacterium yanglingense]